MVEETTSAHPTFGTLLRGGKNNFDAMRFALASLVIFSHSFVFARGFGVEPLSWLSGEPDGFGGLAVNCFFIISGFLIVASWKREPLLRPYAWKRIRRIYPGFIVVCVLCLVVVAPIGATQGAGSYFSSLRVGRSLYNILLLNQIDYQPVYGALGRGGLNGSLWTIKTEFECYIGVAFFGLIGVLNRPRIVACGFVAALLLNAANGVQRLRDAFPFEQELTANTNQVRFAMYFLAGAFCYLYRDRIRFYKTAAILSAIGLVAFAALHELWTVMPLLGTYALFGICLAGPKYFNDFARRGDVSYGLYLYGWPILLMVAYAVGTSVSPYLLFALCFPCSVVAAGLSWFLVEKRFMKRRRIDRPLVQFLPPEGRRPGSHPGIGFVMSPR